MARGSFGELFSKLFDPRYLLTLGFVIVLALALINAYTKGKFGEGISVNTTVYIISIFVLVGLVTSITLRGFITGNFDLGYKELFIVLLISGACIFAIYTVGKSVDLGAFSLASQEIGRMAFGG